MRNSSIKITSIFISVFICGLTANYVGAQTQTYLTSNLYYGTSLFTEVLKLQRFLNLEGLLRVSPTGGYFYATRGAVIAYQLRNNISPTGGVGPLTRTSINSLWNKKYAGANSSNTLINPISTSTTGTVQSIQPVLPPVDCLKNNFTMAFVLVTKPISINETNVYLDKLNYYKNRFPWAFNVATNSLATVSVPNEPVILDSSGLVSPDGTLNMTAVTKKFYQSSPDSFDFLTIFSNIDDVMASGSFYHINVSNNIQGIGLNQIDQSSAYGSKGRLMGINYMNEILDVKGQVDECYQQERNNFNSLTNESNCGMAGLLHELGHQWGVYVGDIVPNFGSNINGLNLPLRRDGAHYYYGLSSPTGTEDVLAAGSWEKSIEGSVFVDNSIASQSRHIKYHPFTLYFMGILPQKDYDTKFNILQNEGSYMTSIGPITSMQSIYKQVSVRDIIANAGSRQCFK